MINVSEIVISLLGSSAISAAVTYFFTKKKYIAEANSTELDNVKNSLSIYREMVEDLGKRIDLQSTMLLTMQAENEGLHAENKALKIKITALEREIKKLKGGQSANK